MVAPGPGGFGGATAGRGARRAWWATAWPGPRGGSRPRRGRRLGRPTRLERDQHFRSAWSGGFDVSPDGKEGLGRQLARWAPFLLLSCRRNGGRWTWFQRALLRLNLTRTADWRVISGLGSNDLLVVDAASRQGSQTG